MRVWQTVDLPILSRATLSAATFAFTVSLGDFAHQGFIRILFQWLAKQLHLPLFFDDFHKYPETEVRPGLSIGVFGLDLSLFRMILPTASLTYPKFLNHFRYITRHAIQAKIIGQF